ncbi:hypothetical protein FBU30_002808, partial [Linnemannia zychae]
MPIFRAKIKGMMLAWYNRWKIEGGTRDWSRLKQDFPEEVMLKRTADITIDEITNIKQRVGETTLNYRARMESNVALLHASPNAKGEEYKLEPQVEQLLCRWYCRGLLPGHPFKVKNKEPGATLTLTYAAVAKYSERNKYGEPTFETRTREANPLAYSLPLEQHFEHKGTKIDATKLAEFKSEFDQSATDQLSMDELADMFSAWQLSSLEERTAAGRAMKTVGYMNPSVARRVFGGTRLAQHIRRAPTDNGITTSRHAAQTNSDMRARTCNICRQEGHIASSCPEVTCFNCQQKGHMSRGCTNDRVERMPMATGANAVPVAERNGARRVQSVSLSQSYVTTKTTHNSSGAIQQYRQERANLPVGPSSHMWLREPNEAITTAD